MITNNNSKFEVTGDRDSREVVEFWFGRAWESRHTRGIWSLRAESSMVWAVSVVWGGAVRRRVESEAVLKMPAVSLSLSLSLSIESGEVRCARVWTGREGDLGR